MNEKAVFIKLRRGGLSAAGACGLMGNMQAESAARANNAQDSFGYDTLAEDLEYTAQVDAGARSFIDGVGYGLCQWTEGSRKRKLLAFARSRGVSVGDESMQVDFCLKELREDFPTVYAFLCTVNGVYEAARRVCLEYERPAINNVDVRAAAADSYFQRFGFIDIDNAPTEAEGENVKPGFNAEDEKLVRTLQRGMFGDDVVLLNLMLAMHGYGSTPNEFDQRTENYVKAFQVANGLSQDGIAGPKTWAALGVR